MGRIRTIKPEFFTHEELSALPSATHLFAGGLLCYADDEGYFNANEGLVKAAVFPLREPSVSVHNMLDQLVRIGYLRIGTTGDKKRWGHIVKFDAHQRVNRPTLSRIKKMEIVWEESMKAHTQINEDSLPEGKGREGKGIEPKPSRAKSARAAKAEPTKTDLAKARHAEFKAIIGKYWESKNPGVQMPWDGREGKHLEMFLRAAPDITAMQFRGFLKNRYRSEVNHGERPSQWIDWVTSYAAGPMDRFGKTIGASGSQVSNPGSSNQAEKPEGEARAIWESMSERYRAENPWGGDC